MDPQILLGLLLTILPVFELRGGLPIIVEYTLRNGIPIWPYFLIVLILNISVIFLIFMFFDFLHENFMNWKVYRRAIGTILTRLQKKIDKVHRLTVKGHFGPILKTTTTESNINLFK